MIDLEMQSTYFYNNLRLYDASSNYSRSLGE
jgi:hypothetical protein